MKATVQQHLSKVHEAMAESHRASAANHIAMAKSLSAAAECDHTDDETATHLGTAAKHHESEAANHETQADFHSKCAKACGDGEVSSTKKQREAAFHRSLRILRRSMTAAIRYAYRCPQDSSTSADNARHDLEYIRRFTKMESHLIHVPRRNWLKFRELIVSRTNQDWEKYSETCSRSHGPRPLQERQRRCG